MDEPKLYRVEVGGAEYTMRLAAPTMEEVRAALEEAGEADALEDETLIETDFIAIDEDAQRRMQIRDDETGALVSLYDLARDPAYAGLKALTCSEW